MANIPGDKGGDWRALKFVDYAHAAPPVHQAFLTDYVVTKNIDSSGMIMLAWFMGNLYSEMSAGLMYEQLYESSGWSAVNRFGPMRKIPSIDRIDDFLKEYSDQLIYGSARKWMRYNDRLKRTLYWAHAHMGAYENVWQWYSNICVGATPRERYDNVQKQIMKCPEYGRFAADLFCEIIMVFQKNLGEFGGKEIASDTSINFHDGANLTSGLFNIMYMDDRADEWDKGGKITEDEVQLLTDKLLYLKDLYKRVHGREVDVPMFVTKICSWRNLFKNARYCNYHLDRQLGYIRSWENGTPTQRKYAQKFLNIRMRAYDHNYLGELHGWDGIRKERKKLWTTRGLTGAEPESMTKAKPTLEDYL